MRETTEYKAQTQCSCIYPLAEQVNDLHLVCLKNVVALLMSSDAFPGPDAQHNGAASMPHD